MSLPALRIVDQASRDVQTSARLAVQHINLPIEAFANPHEVAAYRLWQRECATAAANIAFKRAAKSPLRRGGLVLTDKGWEIPTGPLNPRVIEHDPKPMTEAEAAFEAQVQAEVAAFSDAHEHAVKRADIHQFQRFYREWQLPIRFYFEPVNG